jgi:cell division initiation protein
MPLTPIDIQQKTFGPELRGYNMDEVDDFLDEVVATLKDYDQRVRDAQDRIRALEAEISTRGEDETAISRALVAAQKQADALLAEATEDAERIRSEAHDESDKLRAERDSERMALTQEIARMRATVADLKRRVVELAASAGADLDAMDETAAEASAEVAGSLPGEEPFPSEEFADSTDEAYPGEEETPEWVSEDEEIPGDDTWAESDDEEYSLEEADVPGAEETEEDVDDETWAEVEEAHEEELPEESESSREHDLGELADELAGEAGSRSGQHLSSDENAPRSRRPWERGSV